MFVCKSPQRIYLGKNPPNFPYVEVETSQFTIFRDWLLACHQNTKGKCGISSLTYSQIWLGPLVNDNQPTGILLGAHSAI